METMQGKRKHIEARNRRHLCDQSSWKGHGGLGDGSGRERCGAARAPAHLRHRGQSHPAWGTTTLLLRSRPGRLQRFSSAPSARPRRAEAQPRPLPGPCPALAGAAPQHHRGGGGTSGPAAPARPRDSRGRRAADTAAEPPRPPHELCAPPCGERRPWPAAPLSPAQGEEPPRPPAVRGQPRPARAPVPAFGGEQAAQPQREQQQRRRAPAAAAAPPHPRPWCRLPARLCSLRASQQAQAAAAAPSLALAASAAAAPAPARDRGDVTARAGPNIHEPGQRGPHLPAQVFTAAPRGRAGPVRAQAVGSEGDGAERRKTRLW